jgi:anti-sigma B factor antagonist
MQRTRRPRMTEVELVGDVTVVMFATNKVLDEESADKLGDELFALIEGETSKHVVVNFGGVDVLSSAAYGKLISLHNRLLRAGGKLVLCNIAAGIGEVLEIMKLDKFFRIVADQQTAIRVVHD